MPTTAGELSSGQTFKPGTQETAGYVSNLLGGVDSKL
jgi:hypothetical protein